VGKYYKNCAILSIASSTHMCWTSIVGNIGCVTGPKSHVFGWGEEAYKWIANQFSQSESVCTHVQTPPDPNIICAYTCYCRQYKSSATSFCTQIVVLLLQDVSIWWCPDTSWCCLRTLGVLSCRRRSLFLGLLSRFPLQQAQNLHNMGSKCVWASSHLF